MLYKDFLQYFFAEEKTELSCFSTNEINFLNTYFFAMNAKSYSKVSEKYVDKVILMENNYIRLEKFFSIYGELISEYFSLKNLSLLENAVDEKTEDFKYLKSILKTIEDRYLYYDSVFNIVTNKFNVPNNHTARIVNKYSQMLNDSLRKNQENLETSKKNYLDSKKYFDGSKKLFDDSKKAFDDSKENFDKSEKIFNEAEKNVSGLVSNMLTVLGIFVSIVVAVLIVYITIFLGGKGEETLQFFTTIPQLNLLKYVLSIHLLGDFIFMFLFFIAKLTNRTLMSSCVNFKPILKEKEKKTGSEKTEQRYLYDDQLEKEKPCNHCIYTCSPLRILANRLSHIIMFNGAMLFFYDLLYAWWYIEHLYKLKPISFFVVAKEPYFLFFLILFTLNILLLLIIKVFIIKRPEDPIFNCKVCKKNRR